MNYRTFSSIASDIKLSYDPCTRQKINQSLDRQSVLDQFFRTQSRSYRAEIDNILEQIELAGDCTTGIVMPCTNESSGIERAISALQATLNRREDVSLLVVLNANLGSKALLDNEIAIRQTLLPLKDCLKNLFFVNLSFDPSVGCLGRARKYGLDLFLRHFWKTKNSNARIIFLEADMVSCDEDLVEQYEHAFSQTGKFLLQGRVSYPSYCSESTACRIYLSNRDVVPRALAVRHREFPLFMGAMVIGRNFAVDAVAAAAANSIDPFAFDGAEDDIIFGMDVALSAGDINAKGLVDATVITNPRRELKALQSLYETQSWDHLMSYDRFLTENLSRPNDEELMSMVSNLVRYEERVGAPITAINKPSWEWITRSIQKEELPANIVNPILIEYFSHKVGYWQTEAAFARAINETLCSNTLSSFEAAQKLLESFQKEALDDDATLAAMKNKSLCIAQ